MRTLVVSGLALAALGAGWAQAAPVSDAAAAAALVPPRNVARTASTPTGPAIAPAMQTDARLLLEAGSGRVIGLPAPVANVFVSDPRVVEVRPASPTSLFVFGVTAGHTTVAALDAAGHAVRQYDVIVRPSSFGANEAAGAINRANPDSRVAVDAQPKRLVLNGRVATPAAAQAAVTSAAGYALEGQTVDNQMKVGSQIQVGLKVRIAEMSRSVSRAIGVDWQALGTLGSIGALNALSFNANSAAAAACVVAKLSPKCQGASVNGVIDALVTDNLAHVLAEPNLVAMSGETASFLVGGEFPIPVAGQYGSTTVEFKQYGVALAFVPTVLSENQIRLKVRPEVSALTTAGAVTASSNGNTVTIPALTVRRAETTIELGSGQSFAIAGLLQDQTTQATSALPELGELPIIGALFRSDNFKRQQTELVIIVTPYIVKPVSDPTALRLPTDGFQPPNDLERLLLLRQVGRGDGRTAQAQRVPGQAGFVVE